MRVWIPISVRTLLLLAAFTAGPALGLQGETPPQGEPTATRTGSLVKARQLIAKGQFQAAQVELERAQTLGEGPCGECFLGLSHVYAADKQWDRSVEAVKKAIPLLSSPDALALAYNQLATALLQWKGSRGLAEAEEVLRQAIELNSSWATLARYNLAEVLLKAKRWAAAAAAARTYLETARPGATALKEARIVLCQARSYLPGEPAEAGQGQGNEPRKTEGEVTPLKFSSKCSLCIRRKRASHGWEGP